MNNDFSTHIESFLVFLKEDKRLSSSTISSYRRDVEIFVDFLNENNIYDFKLVTELSINKFIRSQSSLGYKSTTICRRISTLKLFFRFLLQKNIVENYFFDTISLPSVEKEAPNYLSEEDIDMLFSYEGEHTYRNLRDRAIIELIYATGMKASEIIELKFNDVNIDLSYIICRSHNSERILPIGKNLQEVLSVYMKESSIRFQFDGDSYLFSNMRANKLSRQGFWKIIKEYAQKAGIKQDVSPNILRHSFAKHLLENGADIKTVQHLLGHSSISTTQMYISDDAKRLRDVYIHAHPRA